MSDLRLYLFECGTLKCKLHQVAWQTGAMVVTGHDPDAWPKFKKAPNYYLYLERFSKSALSELTSAICRKWVSNVMSDTLW